MPTLQEYRQALASSRDMGGYLAFTATSTSATSTAAKEIICTTFLDDTPNISARFSGVWVYGTTDGSVDTLAGVQRQVREFGLDATTGTLSVTRAFGSTPASGAGWELYWRIPAVRDDVSGRDGYRELINEALRLMVVPDRLDISGVTDQTRYVLNLSMYPWLREPGRIVNVWRPTPHATDLERIDVQAWRLLADGETLVLQLPEPYATGDTFKLEVLRPANSRLRSGGVWTDQTSLLAGLSADTDAAIPGINDVVTVARELAFAEMGRQGPSGETTFWKVREQEASVGAAALKFVRQEPVRTDRAMVISGGMDYAVWR